MCHSSLRLFVCSVVQADDARWLRLVASYFTLGIRKVSAIFPEGGDRMTESILHLETAQRHSEITTSLQEQLSSFQHTDSLAVCHHTPAITKCCFHHRGRCLREVNIQHWWWRPKQSWKESDFWTDLHRLDVNVTANKSCGCESITFAACCAKHCPLTLFPRYDHEAFSTVALS